MDMLKGEQIAAAKLTDWRKLAQGLHARYLVSNFASAARFVAAISQLGTELGHHPRVVIGPGMVDLSLVSPEAIYRAEDGSEYVVEWVTQRDIDLARAITRLAAEQGLTPDPGSVSMLELGLERVTDLIRGVRDDCAGVGRFARRRFTGAGPRDAER